ncbi:MAG: metal-dependent transcriptional regulator [Oscillospiraceae bacterium]|nr:metal-dependent transcriptional regulator [Oscillospiraceae bacterium]
MRSFESREDYLETIYVLYNEKGYVRSIDIAARMNYSKPSVSRAMGLLKTSGHIEMDKDGHITLTETGLKLASQVYERHRVITSFLTSIGVDPFVAAQDACRMEHAISGESFEKLKEHVAAMELNRSEELQ